MALRFGATVTQRRYVVIEGLIGVGKTTLCHLLAHHLKARLVLEPWAENPFLRSFYGDQARFAFPTQMFYLANRSLQQQALRQTELFDSVVIADYLFHKDRLFAEMTLSGEELALYHRFAGLLGAQCVVPDLVIFLDAPLPVLLQRIQRRGIASEAQIDVAYLERLYAAYRELWAHYTDAPVSVIETSALDYSDNPAHQAQIIAQITQALDGGAPPGVPAQAYWAVPQPTLFDRHRA